MKTIVKYSDPSHGWYKVNRQLLEELNISEKITNCSYQLGEFVYLEEDCDMGTFLKAYFKGEIPTEWWNILKVKSNYSKKSSKIRNYSRYSSVRSFELTEGSLFSLYGNAYTAISKNGKEWVVKAENGRMFKLKNSQLCDVRELTNEK